MSISCFRSPKLYHYKRRWCFYLFINLFIKASTVVAQNLYTAFGPLSEINMKGRVSDIFANDYRSGGGFDFGVYGVGYVTVILNPHPSEVSMKTFYFKERIEKVVTGDCNGDGKSDLITLTLHPPTTTLSVYPARADSFYLKWSEELSFIPEQIAVVDINFDKRPDLLLYGKKNLGMYIFLGNGDGTFKAPRFLLEEYSFSHVLMDDVNNDRLMDVMAYDWVRNELLLFSAISPLQFTTPSTIKFSSELTDVGLGYINDDNNIDIVVLYGEPSLLHVYYSDGLGSFSEEKEIPLSYVPTMLLVGDVNGDMKDDVIVFSENERSFFTYMNTEEGLSTFGIGYASARNPVNIVALRSSQSGINKLVVLDKQHRNVLIYHHYLDTYVSAREQAYALGFKPEAVIVFDANRNGLPDLLVANAQSQHISLFLNRGDGTFYGQIPILSERNAESIHSFWKNDSTFVCVTAHPSIDKIGITEVRYPNFESHVTMISAPPNVRVLSQKYDTVSHSLTLIASTQESAQYSIVEIWRGFENKFLSNGRGNEPVERTLFQSLHGATTLAMELCDLNQDGILDVVYVQRDEQNGTYSLFISLRVDSDTTGGVGKGIFQESRAVLSLPGASLQDVRLWSLDLNEDNIPDLIIQYHSDNDYLGIAIGKSDGTFTSLQEIFPQVVVSRRNDVTYVDVNGDRIGDLVISNALTKLVQVFPGRGGGRFSKPKRLLTFPSGGAFTAFDCNGDQVTDYALIYGETGMLKVFLGK
jgi:hypothetical protein